MPRLTRYPRPSNELVAAHAAVVGDERRRVISVGLQRDSRPRLLEHAGQAVARVEEGRVRLGDHRLLAVDQLLGQVGDRVLGVAAVEVLHALDRPRECRAPTREPRSPRGSSRSARDSTSLTPTPSSSHTPSARVSLERRGLSSQQRRPGLGASGRLHHGQHRGGASRARGTDHEVAALELEAHGRHRRRRQADGDPARRVALRQRGELDPLGQRLDLWRRGDPGSTHTLGEAVDGARLHRRVGTAAEHRHLHLTALDERSTRHRRQA